MVSVNEEKKLWQGFDPTDYGHFIGFKGSFPIGTVLTCLLELSKKTVAFYIDGRQVDCQKGISLLSGVYKRVAYENSGKEGTYSPLLYVNFGQVPLKHLPAQFDNLATCLPEKLRGEVNRFKVNLLKERADVLTVPLFATESLTDQQMKCLEQSICECLPILTVKEELTTVRKLLEVIEILFKQHNDFLKIKLPETHQRIFACLNIFADEHEDWAIVEKYAMKETDDWEMHAMVIRAREVACILKGKKFDIKSILKENPTIEKGKCAIAITQLGVGFLTSM